MSEVLAKLTAGAAPLIRIDGIPELTNADLAIALSRMDNLHSNMLLFKYTGDEALEMDVVVAFWDAVVADRTRHWRPPRGYTWLYFFNMTKVAIKEWVSDKTTCSVCKGAAIRWHSELERAYHVENPGHLDPIPCPKCAGSNQVGWSMAKRQRMLGAPEIKTFAKTWNSRLEEFIQAAYDTELDAAQGLKKALNE